MSQASLTRFAFAGLVVGNVALAIGPWLVRLAQSDGGVGPIASGFWRLALAAPVLLLLARVLGQPIPAMPRRLWATLAVAGLFFAADLAAWHAGILGTKIANATLLGNSGSFLFALYGFVVARTLPGRPQALALLLAAGGVVLLLGRSFEFAPQYFIGDCLCLLAGLFYAFYLVALDRARGVLQPLPTLIVSTLVGIPPLLVAAWLAGDVIVPRDWTPLILLALCTQVVGQGLLIWAVGVLPPILVGLSLLTQPLVGAAIGYFVYGELLDGIDWVGALAIAAAVVLVRKSRRG